MPRREISRTGRALFERAMSLRSANANAAHGLSHAMFEQGDMAAGRSFLRGGCRRMIARASCTDIFAWHVALTALDAGDLDAALAIYEQHIKPADRPYPPLNIFTDGASLLWRLSLAARPVWTALAGYRRLWRKIFPAGRRALRRCPPRAGRGGLGSEALEMRLAQLEARAADGNWRRAAPAIELCRGIRRSPKAT